MPALPSVAIACTELHATALAAMLTASTTRKTAAGDAELYRIVRDMTQSTLDFAFATRNIDTRMALRGDYEIVRDGTVPFGAMWQFRRRGGKTAKLNSEIFCLVPLLGDAAIDGTFWLSLWLTLTDGAATAFAAERGVDVGSLRLFPRMDCYTGALRFDLEAEEWSANASFGHAWTSCGLVGKVTRHSMHAAALRRSFEMTGGFEAGYTLTRHVVVDHLDTYFRNAIDSKRHGAALATGGLTPVFPAAGGLAYAAAPQPATNEEVASHVRFASLVLQTVVGKDVGVPSGDFAMRARGVRRILVQLLHNAANPPRGVSTVLRDVRASIAELRARLPVEGRSLIDSAA